MKVSELIELLQDFDGDAEVLFSYNYGDYWRTTVAAPVSSVGDGKVTHSEYHQMDKVVEAEGDYCDEDSEPDPRERAVVLLG